MSKPDRLVLSPQDDLVEELLKDNRATRVYLTGEVCVLESTDHTFIKRIRNSGRAWTRIFEQYHLAHVADDEAQGIMVSAFFDWLSDNYKNEIDTAKNILCYETLFDMAPRFSNVPAQPSVLDIGCGPGTILGSRVALSAGALIGYDISGVAAKAAAAAGMRVISKEQFLVGIEKFDVALSAYTMHYSCNLTETLAAVQRNLKPGGVWLLNFHKDIGIENFLSRISSYSLQVSGQVRNAFFGSIVAVKREGT